MMHVSDSDATVSCDDADCFAQPSSAEENRRSEPIDPNSVHLNSDAVGQALTDNHNRFSDSELDSGYAQSLERAFNIRECSVRLDRLSMEQLNGKPTQSSGPIIYKVNENSFIVLQPCHVRLHRI
ncbi:hypothetical protein GJ496_004454 [Pomphorhynchus laevis]|nr:hypothetical protein GJ496_004454 [Pomphorhynchus laevis]